MFTQSSVGKLAQKLTVMNGLSSARGLMTAGLWLLAAREKAVTFYCGGRDGATQPVLYSIFGHADAGFNALLQGALTEVVEGFLLLLSQPFHLHHKQQILWRFSYFFSSQYVNKRLYTCYYGVTYLLC